jgi:hypothetical protein
LAILTVSSLHQISAVKRLPTHDFSVNLVKRPTKRVKNCRVEQQLPGSIAGSLPMRDRIDLSIERARQKHLSLVPAASVTVRLRPKRVELDLSPTSESKLKRSFWRVRLSESLSSAKRPGARRRKEVGKRVRSLLKLVKDMRRRSSAAQSSTRQFAKSNEIALQTSSQLISTRLDSSVRPGNTIELDPSRLNAIQLRFDSVRLIGRMQRQKDDLFTATPVNSCLCIVKADALKTVHLEATIVVDCVCRVQAEVNEAKGWDTNGRRIT